MICSLCPHAHTCRHWHTHTHYASKEGEKCAPKAVPGSATHTFDPRQTAGAKGGWQLAIPPSGTGYSLPTLVWSRRERRTREIRKKGSEEEGEVLGVTDKTEREQ